MYIEFAEVRSRYTDIITSMPGNYLETVQLLNNHLCTQHISDIFECSSAFDANQLMLKCLLDKVTCKSDVLDFCEILLLLKNAPCLVSVVENLRKSKYLHTYTCTAIYTYICTYIASYVYVIFTSTYVCMYIIIYLHI